MDTYETSIYNAVLTTAFVLGCIIIYFAVSVYRQQRRYIRLQRKFFTEEINLLESERQRIAHDLHDEVGPLLSLSRTYINQVNSNNEKEKLHLQKTGEHLSLLMERMRQIAINITPGSLSRKGLEFSLREFFSDIEEVYGLKIGFIYQVNNLPDLKKCIHMYRILQEITHNTVKHANARVLKVQLKEKNNTIYIFCKDDGIGFNTESANGESKGLGMGSIRNRCEILFGKMQCRSKPNKGTEYFFEFPLKQN